MDSPVGVFLVYQQCDAGGRRAPPLQKIFFPRLISKAPPESIGAAKARQELGGGLRVAGFDGVQELCELGHALQ
jgi:hypothetical protein